MIKKFLPLIFLTGCATAPVPVQRNFPDAVPELTKKCEALITVQGDKVPITDMLKIVVKNYTLYHECAAKTEAWQDWYNKQKKIFEELK